MGMGRVLLCFSRGLVPAEFTLVLQIYCTDTETIMDDMSHWHSSILKRICTYIHQMNLLELMV